MRIAPQAILMFTSLTCCADVMNLNEFMPTHLEDASPIEKEALDFQYSFASSNERNDHLSFHRPNLRYGLTKKIQLEVQGTVDREKQKKDETSAGVAMLYQINKSDGYFPEFGINPSFTLPTDGRSRTEPSMKFLITSTPIGTSDTPLLQVHLNFNLQHQGNRTEGERSESLSVLGGFSHRYSEQLAWVFDYWWNNEEKENVSETFEAGIHYHLGREYYFSLGLGRGISERPVQLLTIISLEKQI